MNIFSLNQDPIKCSQELDDKRLNKMIIESCQLLSTYCFLNKIKIDGLYKPCYIKHPCQNWLNKDLINVHYLLGLLGCYLREYLYRFDKYHKCWQIYEIVVKRLLTYKNFKDFFKIDNETHCKDFPECFGIWKDKIDLSLNHYERMQQLMNLKWHNDKRQPKWTGRPTPKYYK